MLALFLVVLPGLCVWIDDESRVWVRPAVAVLVVIAGMSAILWLRPSSRIPNYKAGRKPGIFDWIVRIALVSFISSFLYFILMIAPPATRQFSQFVLVSNRASSNAVAEEIDELTLEEAEQNGIEITEEMEVGAMFHPDGTAVPRSASLTNSQEPEVSLKTDGIGSSIQLHRSGNVYVHSFSHNVFDGNRWTTANASAPIMLNAIEGDLIKLRNSNQTPTYHYTIFQHRIGHEWNTVMTLQGAHYVRLPRISRLSSGTLLFPPSDEEAKLEGYKAGSTPIRFRDLVLNRLKVEAGKTSPEFLSPSSHLRLNIRVQELSTQFQNPSLKEQLNDFQNWLANSRSYSRTVEFLNNDNTVLESFLEDSGANEGFCVHFASAAALIVREFGVPSRICYGWTGGEFFQEHDQFVFRGIHGHSWTEIFLEDWGWVVFETTPTSDLPQSDLAPSGALPPTIDRVGEQPTGESSQNDSERYPVVWIWGLLAPIVGFVCLLLILIARRGAVGRGRPNLQSAESGSVPNYLQLFYRQCSKLGYPKPIGRTLSQHLALLSGKKISGEFSFEFLEYHNNVTYRELPRDIRIEKRLCREIKGW